MLSDILKQIIWEQFQELNVFLRNVGAAFS